jgi:futalosine hydrolase
MAPSLREISSNGRVLLVVAAPAEARAVASAFRAAPIDSRALARWDWPAVSLAPGIDLLETGIGKVNAGAAAAVRGPGYGVVLNLGVCGALPGDAPPEIGEAVLASVSVYADEGVQTEASFQYAPEMGFALGPFAGVAIAGDDALRNALAPMADRIAPIATVSTCSGTDPLARAVAARTTAAAEAMEGAAIGHVLARLAPRTRFAELRTVSNTTGDRAAQRWDLHAALDRLTRIAAGIAGSRT